MTIEWSLDRSDLIKNHYSNPYQSQIQPQPFDHTFNQFLTVESHCLSLILNREHPQLSDFTMDHIWAIGSRRRVLFKVGNASRPLDLMMDEFLTVRSCKIFSYKSTANVDHRIWVGINVSRWIASRILCPLWTTPVDRMTIPVDHPLTLWTKRPVHRASKVIKIIF